MKFLVFSVEFLEKRTIHFRIALKTKNSKRKAIPGFTLIETLLAISLMCIAITAPMLLTVQALNAAAYARDEITAYYLAQEAIEAVHQIRDGQVLKIAENVDTSGDLFGTIPNNTPFTIDATLQPDDPNVIKPCSGACRAIQTDPSKTLYGYQASHSGTWSNTNFTRTVTACYIQPKGAVGAGTCTSTQSNEMRITVTVNWRSGSITPPSFTLSEDLYRWVQDGSGA